MEKIQLATSLLSKYMTRSGVTVILINEVEEVSGGLKITEIGISYLADNIIFLRYFEKDGELRKAIGVLKKRLSDFEKGLRKFKSPNTVYVFASHYPTSMGF